ncbi:putative peroxisomal-coenzyme A synthetase [Pseudocercospora fuligena]|uniref:Putative peroxisomal-coenzyme A synthetase n=1 Tax=Pseudocercospora fuligena TaxID=685502 RepID=A0A8H6RGI9_9PEZI|nr:putative peroxisomal-coenzyme A synthetase [Pseudocercospora fuligena]
MEKELKKLWASVLGREEADIADNADFFDIGGDSVLAIKLSGAASKNAFTLPSQTIFDKPGLKEMAKAMKPRKERSNEGDTSAPARNLMDSWEIINHCLAQCDLANDDLEDILPCVPFQAELMRAGHELGAWMFQAVFEVGQNSLERAKQVLQIVRERDPTFRTMIVQHESGLYQVISKDRIDWVEVSGELEKVKDAQRIKRMQYVCQSNSISDTLILLAKTYLLWTMSHAIYDRWSKMSSLSDIQQCFADPKTFAASPLRPPFKDFVEAVGAQDQAASLKHWEKQLSGLKTHELLFKDDRTRQYLNAKEAYRKTLDYTPMKGSKLGFDAQANAAWALLLANLSKADDIFFCAIRSCRHMDVEDVQDIIGPLWSLVPFRRKLRADQTLDDLLQQITKTTTQSIQHEPYGIRALDKFFGHKRYLQSMLMPQPPQPDFGQTIRAVDDTGLEHSLRSAEEEWVQTRGHYGLYITLTPKQGGQLELWTRHDEHFIPRNRAEEITNQYAEMLQQLWNSNWKDVKVGDICKHLGSKTGGAANVNGNSDRKSKPLTLTHLFGSLSDEQEALIIPGEEDLVLSHQGLHSVIAQLQNELAKLGIEKGSAVSIALPNSLELIAVFLAATWQRGIAAPLNPGYKQDEFEFYIDDLGSALVVVPKGAYEDDGPAIKAARKYQAAIAECYWDGEIVLDVKEKGKLEQAGSQELLEAEEDDIALVLHTSGTTGRPKAVPLNHKNLMSNIANICRTYSLTPEDRTMLIMPLFHVHGLLASFLSPLYSGGAAIVPKSLEASFWEIFNKHKANWYSATPSMHKLILGFPPPEPLPDIRFIRSCSSQLAPSLYKQLQEEFQCPIVESYAMTEASHLMASNPLDGEQKPGSVGKPQGVDMVLLTAEGEEVSQGEEGEVSIRGPNVTKGYLNNEEANKKEFTKEGFFRTGDQGKFDEDGYLILTGRLKEMINKGGEKISPVELDNTISQHEAIAEVVTFAIDDEDYGQDVGCAVKKAEGKELTEKEMKTWITEKISRHKVPKKIWFCEEIPKTATGKVQRRLVADAMLKQDKK